MSAKTVDLYYMAESPPCRLVEMVASLAGVTLNKHQLNLFAQDHLKEDYLKLNPLHKVPFMVDGDLKINESRAISSYLIDKYMAQNNTLYPKDAVDRARIDEILFIDASLYSIANKLLGPKIRGPVENLDEVAEKAYRDMLAYLESRLNMNGGKKFLFADHITLADVSLVTTFFFPQACDYDMSEFKALNKYLSDVGTAIPNFAEINDKPNENLRNFIKSKQGSK